MLFFLFKSNLTNTEPFKLTQLLLLEKEINNLNADNKQLNQIIIELKIIIAKMYEKMFNFRV